MFHKIKKLNRTLSLQISLFTTYSALIYAIIFLALNTKKIDNEILLISYLIIALIGLALMKLTNANNQQRSNIK